ncbi:MAG: PadR family transcriptional regulator [Clostridia bacterium]|nr:PadR family transcriptional regulator [Clostridia bacterium]
MIMQIGSINLMLLQALKDSSKYGLEIVKYVSDVTNGAIDVKQPSLYSGLNRLEKRGLISSYWKDSEMGGRRHYYTITELGLTQLKLHSAEIQSIMSGNIPTDDEDDSTVDTTSVVEEVEEDILVEDCVDEDDVDDEPSVEEAEETLSIAVDTEQDFTPIDIDKLLNEANDEGIEIQSTTEPVVQTETEVNTPLDNEITPQSTQKFAEYKPSTSNNKHKSFSQKMRAYVEPKNNYSEYKMQKTIEVEDTPTLSTLDTHSTIQQEDRPTPRMTPPPLPNRMENRDRFVSTSNRETTVEYTSQTSRDIDYKNILGELDAELNHTTTPLPQSKIEIPADNMNTNDTQLVDTTEKPQRKSAYSMTLANILTTAKTVNTATAGTKSHNSVNNQQRLDELNRKYDGCAELKCNTKFVEDKNVQDIQVAKMIDSKKTGYSHIAQDSITIKPYVKQDKSMQIDKSYMLINKFNLIRTFIMFVLMCLELGGLYWCFDSMNILTPENGSANVVFIVSAVLICAYVGLMLTFSVPNLQKIVLRESVSWKSDFFYRLLLTLIMITFVIALNLFLGMPTFNDPAYIVQWLVPSVMILNITISGVVGYIVNLFKVQCK